MIDTNHWAHKEDCELVNAKYEAKLVSFATFLLCLLRIEGSQHGESNGIAEVDHDKRNYDQPLLAAEVNPKHYDECDCQAIAMTFMFRCKDLLHLCASETSRLDDLCYDSEKSQVGCHEKEKAANTKFFEVR